MVKSRWLESSAKSAWFNIRFFSVADPDPLVRGTERIRILLSSRKNIKKNLDSYCFVTSIWLFYLLKDDVAQKISKILRIFLSLSWRSLTKMAGSGVRAGSNPDSDSGTAETYPDPYQNITDPQHCFLCMSFFLVFFYCRGTERVFCATGAEPVLGEGWPSQEAAPS